MPQYYEPTQTPPPSEWVAPPPGYEAIMGGLEGLATGAANYGAFKQQERVQKSIAQMARQLRQALMAQGISEAEAEAAAMDYARTGKPELMKALADTRKVAADILQSNAAAGASNASADKTRAEIPTIVPESNAEINANVALTASRNADAAARTIEAETGRTVAATGRTKVEADIEQARLDFVSEFDKDKSGTIDLKERRGILKAANLSVMKAVKAAEADNENLMHGWGESEIRAEAIRRTDEEIKAYEFSVQDVGKLGQPKTEPEIITGGGKRRYRYPGDGTQAPPSLSDLTGEPADSTAVGSDPQTQAAISALKSGGPLKQGITADQIRTGVAKRFPGANIDEVLRAMGF
jgi:hypothetical protein